ncbi:MAG TPA: MFS transporter [Bacillota bacterium]
MLDVLKNARFARLWAGQTLSFLGDWLNITALMSLLAFRWQATAFQMSLYGLVAALPWVVVGPVAGVFADRWNRKTTMIVADLIRAVAVLGFLVARDMGQVFAIVLLIGVVAPFFTSSRTPTIKQIVGREALLPANALSTMALNGAKIIGPAVGGIIVATIGENACFWADSLSFLLSAGLIATVAIPDERRVGAGAAEAGAGAAASTDVGAARPAPASAPSKLNFLADLKAGLDHIARKPILVFAVVLLSLTAFCLGVFDAVAVVFIREVFGPNPKLLGWLLAAIGFGTVVSAVWVGGRGQDHSPWLLSVIGALGMSVPLALLALIGVVAPGTPLAVPLAITLVMLAGLGQSLLFVTVMTVIQTETPGEILGRVSGATDAVVIGSQLIAFPIAGGLATLIGAGPVMLAAGVLLTIFGLAFWARIPRDRKELSSAERSAGAAKAAAKID